jgi:anti-anti-sigma factor
MLGSLESGKPSVGIVRRERDGVVILDLEGKLTGGADSDPLRDELRRLAEERARKIVLNLAGVPWMNSSGLGVLLAAYIQTKRQGGEIKLTGLQERVRGIMTTTKLESLLDTYETEESAVASFRGSEG